MLLETLSENKRRGNFIRIYPSQGSCIYDNYFELSKNNNKFLYQSLHGKSLFTEGSDPGKITKPRTYPVNSKNLKAKQPTYIGHFHYTKTELVIDNNDILVEYMERLANSIKNVLPDDFKQEWRRTVLSFINNSMWKKPLALNQK